MHEAGKRERKFALKQFFTSRDPFIQQVCSRRASFEKGRGEKKDAILLDVSIVSSKFDEKKCFLLAKSRILPTARRPNGKRARKVMRVTGRRFMTICPASERTGV